MDESKRAALDTAITKIQKDYGRNSIMKMSDNPDLEVECIPTGSLALDKALGIGGIPRGRIIELYGAESGGKSTLAMHMVAEVQKMGGVAAYIDAEHAMDPDYAAAIGVDVDELYISQPDCGEQALDIADTLVRSGVVDIVVIDSVAALTPKAELEGDMGDQHVGLLARLMSQACRKLTASAAKSGTTIVFINQLREKVGVMFGNPETQPGGRSLKFYSSVRLDVRRVETVKTKGEATSNKVKIKVVKNKVAPPFKEALTEITFGEGIDRIGEAVDMAVEYGLISKGGAWYTLEDGTRLQGRDATKAFLKEHPEAFDELYQKLRAIIFAPGSEDVEGAVDVEE